MSVYTFHLSPDAASSAQASPNTSLAFIDSDLFSISIEALIKAAATNNPPVAKLGQPFGKNTKSIRSHKKLKSSTSRIHKLKHKNHSSITYNESSTKDNKNYIEPKEFKLKLPQHKIQKMSNTVPRLTKLPQTWWLSYYPPRFLTLFLLGSFTSFMVDHLLTQNHITEYPKDTPKLIDTAAWIPPTCGLSAILIGSLFPLVDYWFRKKPQEFQREWSNVMRCMGGFIGIAYAATKLSLNSDYQVSFTLALISIALWFLFDRTLHGFAMSVVFSSVGTVVMYVLVSHGIYSFTHADFFGVRSWIPCILYSSCVCIGTLGRQLMIVPEEWFEERRRD